MKKYTAPKINAVYFEKQDDILTASGPEGYNTDIQTLIDSGNSVAVKKIDYNDIVLTF